MIIKGLFQKYKSFISYAFFGVCTTIVNLAAYRIFYGALSVPNVASTVIAWLFAVIFAFVTNKLFVFDSKSLAVKTVATELSKFLACRIATGVLDVETPQQHRRHCLELYRKQISYFYKS